MQEDEEFDETLLVETLLGGPDVSYAALYSPIGELVIYAALISMIRKFAGKYVDNAKLLA